MTPPSRRKFLAASGALAGATLAPQRAEGETDPAAFDHADAKLYDATRCIGCRACARRCREVNRLPPDPVDVNGQTFDVPRGLSPNNWMVIQAYREPGSAADGDPPRWSFMKKNCMHCNVPACASACPVAALVKTPSGPVVYDASKCIGCRYCLLACPYGVPRYEWVDRMPQVRKCMLTFECVRACPTRALKSGRRHALIADAHRRIDENPGRYVDHVYGEHEAGGASYLILSGIPLERFGWPDLPPTVRSSYADALMRGLPGWIIGMGLFLGGLYQMDKRQDRAAAEAEGANEPEA